jgi:small-conductance mechanosensitive channel
MRIFKLTIDQWVELGISCLVILATALIARWLVRIVLQRGMHRLTDRTQTGLDDALLDALWAPIYGALVLLAIRVGIDRLEFFPGDWNDEIGEAFFVAYFLLGFSVVWRLASRLALWYSEEVAPKTETELDEQMIPFLSRVILIGVSLIGAIILLSHYEVNVSALVTTLGVGSLALALAGQAALSDTITGFIIMVDRPFRIGDRIEIQDLDTWGDVVDIGLRSCRIRTRDNRMVIIPNSVIGKSLIVNHSYPDTQYRIQVHIGVGYGSDLEEARQTIIEAVSEVEGVLQDQPVEALFLEFGDSALIFRVRWWLESYEDTRRMFDRVNTAVYCALLEKDIDVPYPQCVVHHQIDEVQVGRIADGLGVQGVS